MQDFLACHVQVVIHMFEEKYLDSKVLWEKINALNPAQELCDIQILLKAIPMVVMVAVKCVYVLEHSSSSSSSIP